MSQLNSSQCRNKENLITFHILLSATEGHATQSQLWGDVENVRKSGICKHLHKPIIWIIGLDDEAKWDTSIYSFDGYF